MSDGKTNRVPADASRIAMGEAYEVQYWAEKFDVTVDTLQRAVEAVGNSADAVQAHLQRHAHLDLSAGAAGPFPMGGSRSRRPPRQVRR